jgi:hypothetical protein
VEFFVCRAGKGAVLACQEDKLQKMKIVRDGPGNAKDAVVAVLSR